MTYICLQALHVPHPKLMNMQDDMNEVSRIAHSIKSRLEHLQRVNEAALDRKASRVHVLYPAANLTPTILRLGMCGEHYCCQNLCTHGSCFCRREQSGNRPACAYCMYVTSALQTLSSAIAQFKALTASKMCAFV